MLSVILYGRNDSHGYNYHKRLAISLNCIAEMLVSKNDEIIFIDYNSADDQPTVIEAVVDTLTEKAKSVLKVFRIRPPKKRNKNDSALPGEPLARNAAIVRTNPENKWILSTNIDMVFVPVDPSETLSSLVANLSLGFYALPRFELPENLWESKFNRLAPEENLAFLRNHAHSMYLNTIVRRPGFLMYDNPGDFQLMTRETIFAIDGFNEQMKQGWHLDSNLCKRMALFYENKIETLEGKLWGYHCNHTRQTSVFHRQLSPENDWNTFVRDVGSPDLPEQKETWGLKNEIIEEISLFPKKKQSKKKEDHIDRDFSIDRDSFNILSYSSESVLTHLSDHFHHLPLDAHIAYIGHNEKLLTLIKEELKAKNFQGDILTPSEKVSLEDLYQKATLVIFDFGFDEQSVNDGPITPAHRNYFESRRELKDVVHAFLNLVRLEKKEKKGIKILGVNVLYSDFRALFHHHLYLRKTTFLTGISFGYVKQKRCKQVNRKSWAVWKKQTKFFLMYLLVRYFYRFTDRVRKKTYQSRFLKKLADPKV